MKIAVLEPGAWGTALGIILSRRNDISFWYSDSKLAKKLSQFRKNERLPNIKIPLRIFISSDLKKTIKKTDLIIIAPPSFNFRQTLTKLKKFKNLPPLLGIAKGTEKKTKKLPSQIVKEIIGEVSYAHLSGPGFARETIEGKLTREVIASENRALLKRLKKIFDTKPLKVSLTTDLIGVQLAGAFKNALAIGISLVGANIINNAGKEKVAKKLIQAGLREMIEFGRASGGKRKTFLGPAGLGDLILTSTNPLSRNFQFGQALFSDAKKLRKEIIDRKITVEGFDSIFALYNLGKIHRLNLPIINEIYKVIYKNKSPKKAVENLIKLV